MSPWDGYLPCQRCGKRHRSGMEVDRCAGAYNVGSSPVKATITYTESESEEAAIERELQMAFHRLFGPEDLKQERQKTCRLALSLSDQIAELIGERRPSHRM
jgi:hypothetical protein